MSQPAPPEFTKPQPSHQQQSYQQQSYQPPQPPAPKPPVGGLAIAALVVGSAAFLFGWLVGLGLLLGIAGIVLGILAIRRRSGRVFGVIGLVLSGIATVTNIVVIVVGVALLASGVRSQVTEPTEIESGDGNAASSLAFQTVETPCYSFEGPAHFINNQPEADAALCGTSLELWGETTADGEVLSTGVGAVFGSVTVEPIRVETSTAMAPDDTVDAMVQAMSVDYLPSMGTVESLVEPVTLDGTEANLTQIDSDAEFTELKAVVTARAPDEYQTANGPVRYFIISFVVPDEAGIEYDDEDILAALISTWTWN